MNPIKAIAFDLFDTLLRIESIEPKIALQRLVDTLTGQGVTVDVDTFKPHYIDAIRSHMEVARHSGRETHNRYWIAGALNRCGIDISPDDPCIVTAVDQYFAAMDENVVLLPGTREMLATLTKDFRLGLLSNFTHGPAVQKLLDKFELADFFDATVVSGDFGYRKPHPEIFSELSRQLQQPPSAILFIGDNVEDDIQGAVAAGMSPVWTSMVLRQQGRFSQRLSNTHDLRPDPRVPEIRSWQDLFLLLRSDNFEN